ncbi:ATP-binding protein [Sorangium sp. So ce394]|uniref:ATP-binding protein n=1 Tax=Sorangium sp. So ce394 TaxID=3133310 RepID=UPI003F5BC82D
MKNDVIAVRRHQRLARAEPDSRYRHLGEAETLLRQANSRIKSAMLRISPYREPELQSIDVQRLVTTFLSALAVRLPASIALRTDLDSASAMIEADADLLRLALDNVAKNAAEAMGERGSLAFEWIYDLASSLVVIEIRDTGPGIPQNVLADLRDNRPTASARATGSGLGLHTVQHIVQMHGGKMDIRTGSSGTAVTITLIAQRNEPADCVSPAARKDRRTAGDDVRDPLAMGR